MTRGTPLVLCLLVGSCTDGYPTQDAAADDPWHFTSGRRIEALNELGEIVHPDERWRFRLESRCSLRVERKDAWLKWEGRAYPLQGVDVTLRSSKEDDEQMHELVLARRGQADGEVLLSGPRRFGLRRAQAIVHSLKGECAELQQERIGVWGPTKPPARPIG